MSNISFKEATASFQTPIDFIRFGMSKAAANALYYGHGTDNASDDIRALVLGALQLPYDIDAYLLQGQLTVEEKIHLVACLSARIENRIPVPYVTHEAYFCNLPFYVDERVLIPRSPIGELILQQFSPWIDAFNVSRVLDLCTGSGCIAIACCYAFPEAAVDATDISSDALAVAEMNRERHGLSGMLNLMQSDGFDSIPLAQYDIIVSNPPYVNAAEMQALPKEYQHEPTLALMAEEDGLAVVKHILQRALPYLSEQGILVVEVGNSQSSLMAAYPEVPFTWLDFERGGDGVFVLTRQQLSDFSGKL